MRRMVGALLVSVLLMIGCQSRDPRDVRSGAELVLELETEGGTRSILPDEWLVSDINLLIFNGAGLLEEQRFLSGRGLTVSDGEIRLKTTLLTGVPYDIFVCANTGYALPALSREEVESYRYHLAYPDEYTRGIPMSGRLDGFILEEDGAAAQIPLIRTMARIDLQINRKGLDSDVTFLVASVTVRNGPSSVCLFSDSRAESAAQVFPSGFVLDGKQVQPLNIDESLGVSGTVSLYLPENLQGDLLETGDEREKSFTEGRYAEVCSYLEIRGSYHSSKQHTQAGEYLTYRFYLGDGPGNFDVERNTACRVIVCLQGDGLSEDSWRVEKDHLVAQTRFDLHPAAYNECRSGDDFHLWCDVYPEDTPFEIEPVAWDDDERVNDLYTFDIDPDGHGLTVHTWKGGSVLVHFKAGPPVNRDTLALVVIDP